MQRSILRQRPAHRLAGVPGFARVAINLDWCRQADINAQPLRCAEKGGAEDETGARVALVRRQQHILRTAEMLRIATRIDSNAVNRADKIRDKL